MAESVVTFFLHKLGNLLAKEASLVLGVEREIKSLQGELQWIQAFLKDADGKSKDNQRIRIWVSQIRDIAYEAEDIIDNFILQRAHQRLPVFGVLAFLNRCVYSATQWASQREFGRQIEEINKKIREVSGNKSKYGIESIQSGESSSSSIEGMPWRPFSPPIIGESDVVGIEDDVKELVRRLTRGGMRRIIISIVGMGGLGKTTLAKKVYNNSDVRRHFDCHAWITVSQAYSMRELLQGVIRTVMILPREEMEIIERLDVEDLGRRLGEFLKPRKYLIVVDDIWSEEDWDAFGPVFPDGRNGSRIMLTTRNREVALHACARDELHELQFLPEGKCWELFCRKAFSKDVQASFPPELEQQGKDIVSKCGGLPLAVVVLGGMLSRKAKVLSEWEKVYKSATWQLQEGQNRISGILALSLNDLPYYLKSCFLYCGVFPEDFEIPAWKLTKLWIAEGFVQQRGGELMEDVANDYLEELINRSLIQVVKRSSNGEVRTCRIHDLLRGLSISEARESKFFDISACVDSTPIIRMARRLIVYHDSITLFHSLSHFRSFLSFTKDEDLHKRYNFFRGLKFIRVLDLEGACITRVPNEIGKLIHLRYLGLRRSGIATLPSSLSNLYNLQTLDIRENNCKTLPKKFWKNQSLRHLNLGKCVLLHFNLLYQNPIYVSNHVQLQQLRNLTTLTGIKAGSWIGNSLTRLTHLRKLGIGGVSNVHGTELGKSIAKLDCLQSLWLKGEEIPELKFSHHHHLYKVYLFGDLQRLPFRDEFPANLTKLFLGSSRLKRDPFEILENLPKLQTLRLLHGAYCGQHMHCSSRAFRQLEVLEIRQLDQLVEWTVEEQAMPKLISLTVNGCSSLKVLPEGLLFITSLQNLKLLRMPLNFTQRLYEYEGTDWYKIQHVPSVRIRWIDS